jgi:hypothetical protein
MRINATHDTQGNIHAIGVSSVDSPPAVVVSAEPGLLVTPIEAPEIARLDLSDPESQQQLNEIFEHFRVEAMGEARIVRKTSEAY